MAFAAALAGVTTSAELAAQSPAPSGAILPPGAGERPAARVAGQILRVTADGERGVARQWVILHGIGSAGGRAIDSTRTTGDGAYDLRYDRQADSTAQYFVSTVHHGIAYVSGVLAADAAEEDATLTVFDTTSAPIPLTVRGRHVLIFAPTDSPRRRVAEIYDLSNDTIVTRVAGTGGAPLWSASVAAGVQDFSSGPEMLSNEAITLDGARVVAFAPIAPGLKRIAFTYSLPPEAFPLTVPVEHPTDVFEVLIEDRDGAVTGAGLEETAPSNIEGHMFRRFQGQDIAASTVVTVRVPATPDAPRETSTLLVIALGVLMIGAFVLAIRRARTRPVVAAHPVVVPAESDVDALARAIASLDAEFETRASGDAAEQAHYRERREQLKSRLAERLAARRRD